MLLSYHSVLLTIITTLSQIQESSAAATSQGCYKVDNSLTSQGVYAYQSEGYCATLCSSSNYAVFGMTGGSTCACGNSLPSGGVVSSSLCDTTCSGYPTDICGGDGYYSVWLTGVGTLSGGSGSSNSASTSSSKTGTTLSSTTKAPTTTAAAGTPTTQAPSIIYVTTAVVQQGSTVIQTVSATTRAPTASGSSTASRETLTATSSSSSSKSGISGGAIAGIVIGVLALVAIVAALAIFFLRRRRSNSREASSSQYMRQIEPAGAGLVQNQPPSPDNRLDTSLAIRRNSSESLADNQDYSRRILRVIN